MQPKAKFEASLIASKCSRDRISFSKHLHMFFKPEKKLGNFLIKRALRTKETINQSFYLQRRQNFRNPSDLLKSLSFSLVSLLMLSAQNNNNRTEMTDT